MTKFSVNLRQHRKDLEVAVKEFNEQAKEEEKISLKDVLARDFTYIDDPVVATMCRLARVLAHHMCAFHSTIRNATLHKDFLIKPVDGKLVAFMQSKTPGNIIVFPNLFFNTLEDDTTVNIDSLKTASVYNYFLLTKLIEDYRNGDKRGWTPLSRAITRLTARNEITLPAYITRYTTAKADKMTDAQIRDWAESVNDLFRPVELTFADTPEDFIDMYGNRDGPSSCMTMHEPRPWQFMLDEWGVHPTSFYGYHPHTRGAYLKKGKKIVARCICYETAPGVWKAGRMYYTNPAIAAKFMEGLRQHKINPDEGSGLAYTRDFEFEIPVFNTKSGAGIPVPYVDNMPIGVDFKLVGDKVICTSNKRGSNEQLRTGAGYIPLAKLQGYKCSYCGKSIKGKGVLASDETNAVFCNEEHAVLGGYVMANDAAGRFKCVKKISAASVNDMDRGGTRYFTTMDAAYRHGAGPVAIVDSSLEIAVEDEDAEISISSNSGGGFANGEHRSIYDYRLTYKIIPKIVNFSFKKEVDSERPMLDAPLFCEDYVTEKQDGEAPSPMAPYPPKPIKSPKKEPSSKRIVFI